jgi:DNA-binding Lrp family transcriptional regulator
MQVLKDEGLIHGFKASLSIGYLHAVRVLFEGISQGESHKVTKGLREHESVQSVFIGEGSPQYFLECILRDIKELDSFVGYLRKTAQIPNPRILIDSQVRFGKQFLENIYSGPEKLSRLDYQIIDVLHMDARMSVGDIAVECHKSARTVRNHLNRLIEDGAIDFTIDWRPGNASGLTAMLAIILQEDADQRQIRDELNRRFGGSLFLIATMSNVPGLISSNAWSPSMKKHNELIDGINKCEGVKQVLSTILKDGWVQDTWRDKLLKDKVKKT